MNTPIQQEYRSLAPIYDRRWASYIQKSITATINLIEVTQPDSILDLGCGTGTLLQSLGNKFPQAQLTGLDFSPEMLQIAREKHPDTVNLVLGSADYLPFADHSFALIISTSALHYFPHPLETIQEARRVLKPNGCLMITDWCYDYWSCRFLNLYLGLGNRPYIHIYSLKELEQMFISQGFTNINTQKYKIDWFWGMMTVQGMTDPPQL